MSVGCGDVTGNSSNPDAGHSDLEIKLLVIVYVFLSAIALDHLLGIFFSVEIIHEPYVTYGFSNLKKRGIYNFRYKTILFEIVFFWGYDTVFLS